MLGIRRLNVYSGIFSVNLRGAGFCQIKTPVKIASTILARALSADACFSDGNLSARLISLRETESPDCVSLELCKLRPIVALFDTLAVFFIGEAFPSKVVELFRGAGLASPLAISSAQAGPTDRAATSNRKGKDRRCIVRINVPANDGAFRGKRHSPCWFCEPPTRSARAASKGLQQLHPPAGLSQAMQPSSTGQGPEDP